MKKKNLKYLNRIDEYFSPSTMPMPETKPQPETKPRPDTTKDPKPDLDPFNPPLPTVDPDPKNWRMMLKKCVERFNELYAKTPNYTLKEGIEDNPGVPAYRRFKSELPEPDMNMFGRLGAEAYHTMIKIGQAEQNLFSDEELTQIAMDVVRKIVSGSALEKKGVSFDSLVFDIKFVRDGEDLGSGVQKSPPGVEYDEDIKLAIQKRELINTLSQGFGITSQARLFDDDVKENIEDIESELFLNYQTLMRSSLESHKYMDFEWFKNQMEQMQRVQDQAEESGQNPPGSPLIVPAKMEVKTDTGRPVIHVKAYCLIFAIQEMVKGVFEVVSLHGSLHRMENKTPEEIRQIAKEADNWVIEHEGFVYGPKMVKIFRDFFKEVEDTLIRRGVITEYDETMIYQVLARLYSNQFTSDREFMNIMAQIFNENIDRDLWPVEEIADMYEDIITTRYGKKSDVDDEYDEYERQYDEGGFDDEYETIGTKETEIEEEPSLDDLLDKIYQYGRNSLTPQEEQLLKKYSENQSMVLNFKNFMILQESTKRFRY